MPTALTKSDREALLAAKLSSLPPKPGCYLFIDKTGAVVYAGKAKSLRARVRSYFQEGTSDARYFIPLLRKIVTDLETVVTANEKEAAVLENQLIKQHQPRFNVKLRDDKDFLWLRIDPQKDWPMLETVRRPSQEKGDKARYYGPYHSASNARRTLNLVNKHFQLRTCSDTELASRRRPCLQYQIKRCLAPCVKDVDRDLYSEMVRSLGLFLDGRHDELTGELTQRMKSASRDLSFELAAIYRDQLRAVEAVREEQRVVSVKDVDQDAVGIYREGTLVEIEVLPVRHGRVTNTLSFSVRNTELPDDEVLAGFLSEHYGEMSSTIPDEILLPVLPEGAEGTEEWLSERRGRKVSISVPQRGQRADLLKMAAENAAHAFQEKQRSSDDLDSRLEDLRERLRLPTLPRHIECCDISHLGGGDTVGSIVSLRDGQPDRKHYRSFNVKTASEGDDYAAIYEVLARRFRRGKAARAAAQLTAENPGDAADEDLGAPREAREAASSSGEWDLPDLLVVDGGRGQLQVALSAAHDLGLHGLPIVGLAKERETATGDKMVDRVYLPGQKNGIPLRSTNTSLFFLARIRDEAHRFANYARKRLGKARRLRSEIEDIPGLGAAVKKALLRELGSLDAVRRASDEQILAVPGVTKRHLTALRKVIQAPRSGVEPALVGPEIKAELEAEGELRLEEGAEAELEAEGELRLEEGAEAELEAEGELGLEQERMTPEQRPLRPEQPPRAQEDESSDSIGGDKDPC